MWSVDGARTDRYKACLAEDELASLDSIREVVSTCWYTINKNPLADA